MKNEDYLVTTKIGDVARSFIWRGGEKIELDLPHAWQMELKNSSIEFIDPASDGEAIVIERLTAGQSQKVELPSSNASTKRRPVEVELTCLKALTAVYDAEPSPAVLQAIGPRQVTMYYGQRYFLVHYRPIGQNHDIKLDTIEIFTSRKSPRGYWITSQQQNLQIEVGEEKQTLPVRQMVEISESDFFSSTFRLGIHWWRFHITPTPDSLPPLETDENEDDELEKERFKQSTIGFLTLFLLVCGGLFVASILSPPKPKPTQVEVTYKQPKLIPPLAKPPELIKPPEPKKPEPKKPEPKKPEPKKAEPKRAKAPKKKAVTKPAPVVQAPPKPVVSKEPPKPQAPPAPSKADQLAAQKQAQQTQLLKSLSFLSNSQQRPAAEVTDYKDAKGKFAHIQTEGGLKSTTNNALDSVAKGSVGDGTIRTGSSRTIKSEVSFGKNKGLNDVQGKVSAAELGRAGSGLGSSLGGGKGLEVSGPGQLAESAIEKALAKYLSRFQYCYEKALLSDSSLGGNLTVGWSVTPSGGVADSRVLKSQLNNEDLHKCVLKVLAEVSFPHPKGGSVTVKKTFTFSSSSL